MTAEGEAAATKKTANLTASNMSNNSANQKSNTENTVFVRFHPPSSLLRRHHIEQHFSQVGPIKKASLIIPKATTTTANTPEEQGEEETFTKRSSASYGFIRYTCRADAVASAKQLNQSTLKLPPGEARDGHASSFQVKVELASDQVKNQKDHNQKGSNNNNKTPKEDTDEKEQAATIHQKKHSRIILRNLSFYAKESHIEQAVGSFGKVVDIHVPQVKGQSRGFAFCTFARALDAQKCVVACQKNPLQIKQRPVQVALSLPKAVHQVQKESERKQQRKQEYRNKVNEELSPQKQQVSEEDQHQDKEEDSSSSDSENDDDDDGSKSENDSDSDDNDSDAGSDDKDVDDDDKVAQEEEEKKNDDDAQQKENQAAIEEERELFVRNLPFDATRHDVFETFRKFGKIDAIYLVSDPKTGLPRGTCFVTFDKHAGAERAMKAGGGGMIKSSSAAATTSTAPTSSIVLKGRSLFMDYAVDRETANTLKRDFGGDGADGSGGSQKHKDKRNLYLKGEGRVDVDSAWAALGENDKLKRQRAWSDKNTKLKSPLFFINPHRLSIRNLSKSVDEGGLKQLLFQATKKGLEKGLVSIKDQEAHWRAAGELSSREILEHKKALKALPDTENPLKAAMLDEKNLRKTLPSVFLDRDFSVVPEGSKKSSKAQLAPSRGFAFCEFEHHVQALACLRELNNNPAYSEAYAAGGKAAANSVQAAKKRRLNNKKKRRDAAEDEEEATKIPRLVVEFTVENRAKARQQAERRAQQQANREKNKLETRERKVLATTGGEDDHDEPKSASKKRGRGAKQREKKRHRHEEGQDGTDSNKSAVEAAEAKKRKFQAQQEADANAQETQPPKIKGIKPPKKQNKRQREDMEADAKFNKLVNKYKAAFVNATKEDTLDTDAMEKKKALVEEKGKRWYE